jgi:DNA repair protein RecO
MPAPRQITTEGIVLKRVNYGEADRIVTFLTPDQGKLAVIAKGARKPKSKLAGGLEVFSVSEISFIKGRKDIDTLTSSRLRKYFGNIVKELARSDVAYNFIKLTDKATEDNPEPAYFNLLAEAFKALDDQSINPELTQLWFNLKLLKTTGHAPDFFIDTNGNKLLLDKTYDFDYDQMRFARSDERQGSYNSELIKFLRVAASAERPHLLQRIQGSQALTKASGGAIESIVASYFRT